MDHQGLLPQVISDKADPQVAVAVEGKVAALMPSVGNIPQHEESVQFLEGIACIKQRYTKSGVGGVMRVILIVGCILVDPGVICCNGAIQNVPIFVRIFSPARQLWPNCSHCVEVGFDPGA